MEEKIPFSERLIAFTDLETTGLEPFRVTSGESAYVPGGLLVPWHEICEIGLVLVNPKTLEIIATKNWKVQVLDPNPDKITEKAREVSGFDENLWKDAIPLKDALREYVKLTDKAVFAAHNVTFDWGMLSIALAVHGMKSTMDYHRIDTWSYAVATLNAKGYELESYNLSELCKFLGLGEEPMPHRAINGATKAFEVYKAIQNLPAHQEEKCLKVGCCCGE